MEETTTARTVPNSVVLPASNNNRREQVVASQSIYFLSYNVPAVHPIDMSKYLPALHKKQRGDMEPVYVDNFNRLTYDSKRMEFGKMYTITWNDNKLGLRKNLKDGKSVVDLYEFEPDV